ncbi:MAG: tyrosine-type recombinase/integrase, partial [Verrucomicrobia bacterium]|nr:tyrosine-type recombinase/integrase [Verrucomicrobiota bacterium]
MLENRKKMVENMASKDEYNKLQAQVAVGLLKKKYGVTLEGCPLSTLESKVENLIKHKCCADHLNNVLVIVRKFVEHVNSARTLEAVTEAQIQSYLDSVDAKHPANRTYNEHIRQLKRIFREFCSFGPVKEYVAKLSKRVESDARPREIFTSEEIEQILDVSKEVDPLVHSMVVIASCTGLRLKDICLLKWESINFRRNLITLTTHKTGGDVILGMWPTLRDELLRL